MGSASCQSAVYKSSIPCLFSGRLAILQERTLRAVKIQCWLTLQVEVLTAKGRDKEGKAYKQQGGTEMSELQRSRVINMEYRAGSGGLGDGNLHLR